MIAGLLLAAGGARRFGTQKLVAPLHGQPLVRHAADALSRETDRTIAVVGKDADAVRDALRGLPIEIVVNEAWASGLSGSVRAGIAALPADAEAVVIALGDQPVLDPGVVRQLIERWRVTAMPIVAARYRGTRGHPVLFAREVFGELAALHGDVGAKPMIERSATRVAYADIDADAPIDVDIPEDLATLGE